MGGGVWRWRLAGWLPGASLLRAPSFISLVNSHSALGPASATETQAFHIKQDPTLRGGLDRDDEADALSHSEKHISRAQRPGAHVIRTDSFSVATSTQEANSNEPLSIGAWD